MDQSTVNKLEAMRQEAEADVKQATDLLIQATDTFQRAIRSRDAFMVRYNRLIEGPIAIAAQAETKEKVPCPDCGDMFYPQGLNPHRSRKHRTGKRRK